MFKDDTPLNYKIDGRHGADFAVKKQEKIEHPTADQVAENKQKWGWA